MNNNLESKNIKEWYNSNFKTFEEKLNGHSNSFLQSVRKEGLKQLSVLDFPTSRMEEWKYTDIAPILKQFFVPAVNTVVPEFSKEDIKKYLFSDFDYHLLVFINGIYSIELSEIGDLPAGVVLGSLNKVTIENPELIKNYINKISGIDNAFNALNNAYAFDGLVMIVPDGKIIDKPVQVLFLNTSNDDLILSSPRNLVIAGKNSQASIVANYCGCGSKSYFNNIITEVYADEYSLVDYYKIQNEIDESYHIEKFQVQQKNNSIVNHYNISFGGAIIRNDINALIDGQNTETHYYGIYLAHGKQLIDNHTFIDHAKPNCMSNELYKGILDQNSRGVFNGKIIVRKDAQKTNAYQQNKTILLSKNAKIDTKPQLEIFADDVKCSHGATVGQLDDVSEFYIRSRGVPQELAKSMLIRAFTNDVIEKIKIEQLRAQINHMVFQHLSRIDIEDE
jgi:Fe-S cluster assembly protein SufD